MKTGSILAPGSGKLGGIVWSRNKGGQYIRLRVVPTNPTSSRQQEVRGILATLSAAWESLTDSQRSAWESWAENNPLTNPLGQQYVRTGHQAYVGINARLMDAAITVIDDPPATPVPAVLTSLTITFVDTDSISVAYAPALTADEALYLWMSTPQEGVADPNFPQSVLVGYSALEAASPVAMELPKSVMCDYTVNFWGGILSAEGQVGVALKDRQKYTCV